MDPALKAISNVSAAADTFPALLPFTPTMTLGTELHVPDAVALGDSDTLALPLLDAVIDADALLDAVIDADALLDSVKP